MTTNTRAPLFSPSRRSLMKLAGAGAVGAATALSACAETATAATPADDAIDPNAMAILSANENPYGPVADGRRGDQGGSREPLSLQPIRR